jgi:hypothetical protein
LERRLRRGRSLEEGEVKRPKRMCRRRGRRGGGGKEAGEEGEMEEIHYVVGEGGGG